MICGLLQDVIAQGERDDLNGDELEAYAPRVSSLSAGLLPILSSGDWPSGLGNCPLQLCFVCTIVVLASAANPTGGTRTVMLRFVTLLFCLWLVGTKVVDLSFSCVSMSGEDPKVDAPWVSPLSAGLLPTSSSDGWSSGLDYCPCRLWTVISWFITTWALSAFLAGCVFPTGAPKPPRGIGCSWLQLVTRQSVDSLVSYPRFSSYDPKANTLWISPLSAGLLPASSTDGWSSRLRDCTLRLWTMNLRFTKSKRRYLHCILASSLRRRQVGQAVCLTQPCLLSLESTYWKNKCLLTTLDALCAGTPWQRMCQRLRLVLANDKPCGGTSCPVAVWNFYTIFETLTKHNVFIAVVESNWTARGHELVTHAEWTIGCTTGHYLGNVVVCSSSQHAHINAQCDTLTALRTVSCVSAPWMRYPIGADAVPHTLVNMGNSCYLNAVLQALFSLRELKSLFFKMRQKCEDNIRSLLQSPSVSPADVRQSLAHFSTNPDDPCTQTDVRLSFTHLWCISSDEDRVIVPHMLLERFHSDQQEDAQEFLQALVQDTGVDMQHLFEGIDTPILVCQSCSGQRLCDGIEFFTHLPLSLDEPRDAISVQSLIDSYLSPQVLAEDFEWTCGTCGNSEAPNKNTYLQHAHPFW